MRHGLAALAPALASLVALATAPTPAPAPGVAAPVDSDSSGTAGTLILSCAVSSALHFDPGVRMASLPQTVSGALQGPGPVCGAAPDGIAGLDATLTGKGAATCLPDPVLTSVGLSGTMAITWNAGGETAGSSQVDWAASRVDLGSVQLTGRVSSGLFTGAALSVSGLPADAITGVSGGCTQGSPLTDVRTSDTNLRLVQG